jgi:hypothetical protein
MWYPLYVLIVLILVVGALIRKSIARGSLEVTHKEREERGSDKVLYLRSFKLDGKGMVGTNMDMFENLNLLPPELDLAKALIKYDFHLITVGRPGQEIPDIGFDRKYFGEDVWHEEVIKLINESVLIIYRPDTSDAILWEFEQVIKNKAIDKLLIWADMGYNVNVALNRARYHIFQKKALQRLQEELPEFDKWKIWIALDEEGYWEGFSGLKFKTIPAFKRATANKKPS